MIILTQEILQKVTDNHALIVLIRSIAMRANNDQTCFPSLSTIAEDTNLAKSTVQKALDYLIEKKVILKRTIKRDNGGWSNNYYTISTEDIKVARGVKLEEGELNEVDSLYRTAVDPIPQETTPLYRTAVTNSQVQKELTSTNNSIEKIYKKENLQKPKFDPQIQIQEPEYNWLADPIREKFLNWFLAKPGKRTIDAFKLSLSELAKLTTDGQAWLIDRALEKQITGNGWQGIKAEWYKPQPPAQAGFSPPKQSIKPGYKLDANARVVDLRGIFSIPSQT